MCHKLFTMITSLQRLLEWRGSSELLLGKATNQHFCREQHGTALTKKQSHSKSCNKVLSFLKTRTIWISMEINLVSTDWIVSCASLPQCSYENFHPFHPQHSLILYHYLALFFSLQLHLLLAFPQESLLFTRRWLPGYLYLAVFIISKTQKDKFILCADAIDLSSTFTAN